MSSARNEPHPVAQRRAALGWSQDSLASRAGIPRSSISAVEAGRLTPSVTTALRIAAALDCGVEELFGQRQVGASRHPQWAWEPHPSNCRYWEAEVNGRHMLYPAETLSGSSWAHDGISRRGVLHERIARNPTRTLVLAGCDPAAGLLSAEYAAASGFRLLAFPRGGGAALDLLKQGAVHVAALHRSTAHLPQRNLETVRNQLGAGFRLLRCADWQEGVVLPRDSAARTVSSCVGKVRHWAAREIGSAARECLDELVHRRISSRCIVHSHQAVVDAVRSGWAEAGVCVQLSAVDGGLRFLPVRKESLDLCFPASLEHDPRLQALIRLLRSRAYRKLIDDLPGYEARHAGEMVGVG